MTANNGMINPIVPGPHIVIKTSFDQAVQRDAAERGADPAYAALPTPNIPKTAWEWGVGDFVVAIKNPVSHGNVSGVKRRLHNGDASWGRRLVFANAAGLVLSGEPSSYQGTAEEIEEAAIDDAMSRLQLVGIARDTYSSNPMHGTDAQAKGSAVMIHGAHTIRVPTKTPLAPGQMFCITMPPRAGRKNGPPDLDAMARRDVFTIKPFDDHGATAHLSKCVREFRTYVERAKTNPLMTPWNIHSGRTHNSRQNPRKVVLGASTYTGVASLAAAIVETLLRKGVLSYAGKDSPNTNPMNDVNRWQNEACDVLGLGTEAGSFSQAAPLVTNIIDDCILGEIPGGGSNPRHRALTLSAFEILMASVQDSNNEFQKVVGTIIGHTRPGNPLVSSGGEMNQYDVFLNGM